MAAVAARTRRLKFGPSVLVAPFRAPVLAARQLAMLDYLSGGRALPAVGIGVEQEREFRAAGVPFKERGRRTDEAIRIMRRCWAEDEVTHEGEFWKLERVTVLPKPVQQPIPVWIGGNSEAAMRRAGRLGDGWIPSFIAPEPFRAGVEKTCAFAAEAGGGGAGGHFGALLDFLVGGDPARARGPAPALLPRGRVRGWHPAVQPAGAVPRGRREDVRFRGGGGARGAGRPLRRAADLLARRRSRAGARARRALHPARPRRRGDAGGVHRVRPRRGRARAAPAAPRPPAGGRCAP